jgi:hypothetical protein
MTTAKKCVACGSSDLQPGKFFGTGKLTFIPDSTKFWTLTTGVHVTGELCMNCGVIMLTADPDEVSGLLPDDES